MMRSLIRIVCFVAASVICGRGALADDEIAKPIAAEAREHLAKGTRHYRLREFARAIEEYKAGAIIEDAPVFHYNLGQCYRQLGRPEDAIWHYQRFLDRASPLPPKYKKASEDFMRDMKAEIDKRRVAKPIDPEPSPKLDLRLLPPASADPISPSDPWYADGFGWGLTGTGAIASGVAIWLLVDAKNLYVQANASSSQQTQNELRERAGQRRLAGTIVGVTGGLALAAGIAKLAITQQPSVRRGGISLNLVPTSNGIAIAGRF